MCIRDREKDVQNVVKIGTRTGTPLFSLSNWENGGRYLGPNSGPVLPEWLMLLNTHGCQSIRDSTKKLIFPAPGPARAGSGGRFWTKKG